MSRTTVTDLDGVEELQRRRTSFGQNRVGGHDRFLSQITNGIQHRLLGMLGKETGSARFRSQCSRLKLTGLGVELRVVDTSTFLTLPVPIQTSIISAPFFSSFFPGA